MSFRSFVSPNHTQTMMGKALHAACVSSRVNDRFQESLYILLELLRAGVVHGGRWGGPDAEPLSGGPSFGSEEDQSSTLLIMRVLSILPLNFRVSLSTTAPHLKLNITRHAASTMDRPSLTRALGLQLLRPSTYEVIPTSLRGRIYPNSSFRRRTAESG